MSIRKKIILGFLCLGIMLAFSGMISMFELNKLSRSTQSLLDSSMKSMALSKDMLDASQEQNTALLQSVVFGQTQYDSVFTESRARFENTLLEASAILNSSAKLDPIYSARDNYYQLIDNFLRTPVNEDINWYLEMYRTSYLELTTAIKNYMVATQQTLLNKAEQLESNAYRAIMPGVITLCVAILIVIVFAFLVNIYYIKPILRITKGLDSFLQHKFPYNVEVEGSDEIARLNGQLEELVALAKNRISE